MRLLPKSKRPPPRILVRAKETPESGSTVTWTMMMELTCTLKIIPNVMGFLPLNLGDAGAGWCGDNMFGMRTAPNGLDNDARQAFSGASTEGNSYKTQFRDGTYNVSTDNYPVSWKRHDNFTTQHADYADYHDYIMKIIMAMYLEA